MEYLLLLITVISLSVQNILKKSFNTRGGRGVFLFSAISVTTACFFFIVINRDWYYSAPMLLYSIAFAVSYTTAVMFSILAIREGLLAKTNLISSFSLLIPTFYGILFLNEPTKPTLFIGLGVLAAALIMINYRKKKDNSEEKATWRWVLYVVLSFIGNGMCSTVQKLEGIEFGPEGKNTFMIVALAMSAVTLCIAALMSKGERKNAKETVKIGLTLALICGVANGLTNLLVMVLNGMLPASIMFPVLSAGSTTAVFLYSTLVVKEKFSTVQKLGYLFGVISIVLLNL